MAITLTSSDGALLTQIAREGMRTAISYKEQWYACLGLTDKALPHTATRAIALGGTNAPSTLFTLIERMTDAVLQGFDANFNYSTGVATAFYCSYPTVTVDEQANEVIVSVDYVAPTEAEFRAGTYAPSV